MKNSKIIIGKILHGKDSNLQNIEKEPLGYGYLYQLISH